ncbi:hypothetical protein [Nostoc sp. CALU 546]|uniref:hypothetical protein n=1 Tax=Nostoc sp. CALU 546 TaxID=1867241 RepID=UPI003B680928
MQPLNINSVIFRYLFSFGIVVSNLYAIEGLPASAQSSASERIECIKLFAKHYYSYEGGNLNRTDALAKAEQTCAEQSPKNNAQPTPIMIIPTNGIPANNIPNAGGSPKAITDCMKRLMYERKLVCTRSGFPGCSHFPSEGFAGWQMQDVRTELSEAIAVQACQNAR